MGLPTFWNKQEAHVVCYQKVSMEPFEDLESLEGYEWAGKGQVHLKDCYNEDFISAFFE